MWIHETTEFGCSAIVSSSGFPGRRYRVERTPNSAVIEPMTEPAQGGSDGLISFTRTTFEAIVLDVAQDARIETATADVFVEWNQEDVWDSSSETIDLSVTAAGPGKVEVPEAILPWTRGEVLGSRPTSGLSQHVSVPSDDWSVTDLLGGGEGITEAEFFHGGDWDEVRGRTLSFALLSGLVDISGAAMETGPFDLSVRDIGPALVVHEMFDTSTVATWGFGTVEPYAEGDCSTLGCVVLESWGGDYVGLAGQLLTEGATSAVVTMRPSATDPLFVRVEVVAEDGTLIPAATGGSWNEYEPEQIWTYDVAGHKRVGFSIEVAANSHGWGGPLVVEGVAAQ
jgi:hypothetical protein